MFSTSNMHHNFFNLNSRYFYLCAVNLHKELQVTYINFKINFKTEPLELQELKHSGLFMVTPSPLNPFFVREPVLSVHSLECLSNADWLHS